MRTLQAALAKVHGARSREPHPLLVSLALEDSDDEEDEEEHEVADLDIRVGAISLAENEDGSMQFFGSGPSPLARRAPASMVSTAATLVRATFNLAFNH
jgi:hypothetical protein